MAGHRTLADAVLEEGIEQGPEQGAAVAAEILLTFLRLHWDMPPDLAAPIGAERSLATLEHCHELAMAADGLRACRQAIAHAA